MRHIIPISGKDSLATALVQRAAEPGLPYEYVFNPTGAELPEVFEWLKKTEAYLGAKITIVGNDLFEIIEDYNYFLPSRRARYCTRKSKIEPFEKWMAGEDCTVYYGIRADEAHRKGYENPTARVKAVYPLVSAGIGIQGVYQMISEAGLKPPTFFWKSVYEEVLRQVGATVIGQLTEWQRDMIFAGRTRANCYFCFNQRLYEWVWLLETYPDLFWQAEAMEHLGGEKTYVWNGNNRSLKWIADHAEALKKKRVRKIVKFLRKRSQSALLLPDEEDGFEDLLNIVSCGLLCGK